jgi:hypothetical protein
MKNLLKIFSFVTAIVLMHAMAFAEVKLKDYKAVSLAKGSFLKAVSLREVSTSTVKTGDFVYFINPSDIYIGESNVIPKNSIYTGRIESVIEAVEGVNAAMKIKIMQLNTPDDVEYTLDAYVFWNGTTTVGGDLAQVEYYAKMPHYTTQTPKGVLQLVPTSVRYFGKPRVIKAGEEVTFILNKETPLYRK